MPLRLAPLPSTAHRSIASTAVGRLRVGLTLGNVAVVCFRYALTDRRHHVPSSPLRMVLIQSAFLTSVVELLPVAPILAVRALGLLLLGRPALDALHHMGFLALLRPFTFRRAAHLRSACTSARTHAEWKLNRLHVDEINGGPRVRSAPRSPFYDFALVETALLSLGRVEEEALASRSPRVLTELLRTLVNRRQLGLPQPPLPDAGRACMHGVRACVRACVCACVRVCACGSGLVGVGVGWWVGVGVAYLQRRTLGL